MDDSPPFGQADLSNCERELIHLAGSIQPHGVMLVLRERDLLVQQVSSNTGSLLGLTPDRLLQRPLAQLGGDLDTQVRQLATLPDLEEPQPLQAQTVVGGQVREWDGSLHRIASQGLLVIELEPQRAADGDNLLDLVSSALHRFSHASSIGSLSDALVRSVRDLTGYDRVMVYKFDPDGHGKIIAEARDPRLDSLLGHHYPATDIPQRARELYLRIRVRVLSDVHYQPVPLQPLRLPDTDQDLDMSMCGLRSMSPLHLQYLKNMGVTGTLVVSLVREGRLWGLIAAHHYSPRNLSVSLRSTCDLLAEVAATRIAAIENYTHAQVGTLVRRLEQRLVEATSTEGDWRLALFRNPRTLLQPLEATGAALFHDGEVLTSGEVPSTPELRALLKWVDQQYTEAPFSCSSVAKANPDLDTLTPVASGVLAIKLSTSRPDFLMWFRKEQLLNVTWAGDPTKPVVGNDPLELSPRRSFAAWSEIVRGTAVPWSGTELALARAVCIALVDIIVQVHAVRLLVGEHQLATVRATVGNSVEPVAVADGDGRLLFVNPAFRDLMGCDTSCCSHVDDIARAFTDQLALTRGLESTRMGRQAWRGELELARPDGLPVPVSVRAEVVPGRDGSLLGFIIILSDLSNNRRADAARRHLEQSLKRAVPRGNLSAGGKAGDEVMGAILTNASLAAMDIADNLASPSVAPLLQELEATTKRAADLYGLILGRKRSMPLASGPETKTPSKDSC
ncbi:MAG: GAF domain-containing protein [Burkholderiales bacterium]|nr:GAF domain-containing protein [Burkholderiales bacterium]